MTSPRHGAPAPWARTAVRAALAALAAPLLAACGGGGGGGAGDSTPPTPPPVAAADTESLPTARAVFDFARATAFLASDVQNIIVLAPALLARGDRLERCDQGGNLQTVALACRAILD